MSISDLSLPHQSAAAAAASLSPGGGINDDLVTEILLRLPVRSLKRFEVVTKSWLSQITDPKFIGQHLDRKKAQENPWSMIISGANINFGSEMEMYLGAPRFETREYFRDPKVRDIIHFYCPSSSTTGEEMREVGLPYNFLHRTSVIADTSSRLILIGVINGIVCAMNVYDNYQNNNNNNNNSIFLWNPATFGSKELPEPNILPQARKYEFSIGFGFESNSNDYKVVRIVKIGIPRAEVYSAKDMFWKEIKNVEERYFENINHFTFDAFIDGVLYWLAGDDMITLDLSKEEFQDHIELPMLTHGTYRKIVEFNDSVALSSFRASHATKADKLSFWTLVDRSGKGTWSKKYSFEVLYQLRGILWHLRNGDIVGELGGSSVLFYDHRNKNGEVVKFPLHKNVRQVFKYTATLVSIPGFERVKYTPW